MWRSILVGAVVICGLASMADEPKPNAKKPPYERLLQGDDAKKAAEFQKAIEEAEQEDRYKDAITLSQELIVLRTKLQGDDHWETVDERWAIAVRRRVGDFSVQDRDAWRTSQRRKTDAEEFDTQGDYAKAHRLWQQHLQVCLRVFGEKHPTTAQSYRELASNLMHQDRITEAQPLLQKSLDICLEIFGEMHPSTADSYNDLAYTFKFQSKYVEAQTFNQKALDLYRELLGDKHVYIATSCNNLALCLSAQAKYEEAEPLLRNALAIYRELLGEKNPNTANSYNSLAGNLHYQGKHADALPLFQRALELQIELVGERHKDVATGYNNLASSLKALGMHADAQQCFERALDLYREVLGENSHGVAVCLSNMAGNLAAQGKYADAQPLFEKALELHIELVGENNASTALVYNNLALNMNNQRRYAEAQDLFQRALDLTRGLLTDKHPDTARCYDNLAYNLSDQGRYGDAQPLHEMALKVRTEVLGEKHPDTAASYSNLAYNLHDQGKHTEAQRFWQRALDLRREVLGDQHPETAVSFNRLAYSLIAQGLHRDACKLLGQGAVTYEAARLTLAHRGRDRAVFGRDNSPYRLLAATQAHLASPAAAWVALEKDLARGLNDELAFRRGAALSASEQNRQSAFTTRLNGLRPLILELVSKQQPTNSEKDELMRLRAERRTMEAQLAELAVALSERGIAVLSEVQTSIPTDAALVAWVDESSNSGLIQEHWGCVVRAKGEPAWERLPGTGPELKWTRDDGVVANELRDALTSKTVDAAQIGVLAQKLHARRIAPLTKHLDGVKFLYVIAVNEMAGIPVELLTQDYAISYVPSGTFLYRLKEKPIPQATGLLALGDPIFNGSEVIPKPTALPPGGLLIRQVFAEGSGYKANLKPGDVIVRYGETEPTSIESLTTAIKAAEATPTSAKADQLIPVTVWRQGEEKVSIRSVPPGKLGVVLDPLPAREAIANRRKTDEMLLALRGGDWKELPATRTEVTQLATLFGPGANTLLDSAASEQSLDEIRKSGDLSNYRYLHFATHGEANNVRAFESTLILSQDTLPKDSLPRAGEPFMNGQLSANEVLEFWSLDAELVTLSACETAVGRDGGGDGLLGFAQAFLTAGSRAICLSLWKVDDTATALLMTRFYQNLLGKRPGLDAPMPKAAALHEAKRWLRELSKKEVEQLIAESTKGLVRGERSGKSKVKIVEPPNDPAQDDSKPYAHPRYWSAFILIGDPN